MKTLKLESGTTGFYGADGKWIPTGSAMGRPNRLPDNRDCVCKLQLTRVPFVDGAYDRWGAYWGTPSNLWCAWGDADEVCARVFVRANSRDEAKAFVRTHLKNARFYR